MKKLYTLLLLLTISGLCFGQTQWSKVKIQLNQEQTIRDLAALGLDVDHGDYAPYKYFISDFSDTEIVQIESVGFQYEILIEDVVDYYVNQKATLEVSNRNQDCVEAIDVISYPVPENYHNGSMGGYFTYQEMLEELTEMQAEYPNLISSYAPIGDILTHEGNPVYWLRLSDNPNMDEEEPEVLYTSLHHAREPGSLTQLIFFMWYMLENYETDSEIQWLVDNTELYFIPCINPDGYLYNEFTNPDGGGLWRKNRRDNQDGSFGVDLNRNYDFFWGFDDVGSSPNPESSVYRGPSGFSEPETQAVRDFCNDHEFQIALNYHTYGNLLIYPWAYLDTPTPDSAYFGSIASAINRENSYFAGTATETVGYQVNGPSDDWMYGETTSKPPIFSMTPEVGPGNFGFWPPESFILDLCFSTVLQNITTAQLVHNFGLATDQNPSIFTQQTTDFQYKIKRYGLAPGNLEVSLTGISSNITSTGPLKSYTLSNNEEMDDAIAFTLDNEIEQGAELVFLLSTTNGILSWNDTITKTYYDLEEPIYTDPANNITTWVGDWGITTEDFVSSPASITDSPFSDYPSNVDNIIISETIDLSTAEGASLRFWGKWDLENNFDYIQVSLIVDEGSTIIPLCGNYTQPGNGFFQPEDEPVYNGTQSAWVQEEICIDDFIGQSVQIQFSLASDGFVERDGYYFDDLEVITYLEDTTSSVSPVEILTNLQIWPNPAVDFVKISSSKPLNGTLTALDALGNQIEQLPFQGYDQQINTQEWPSGVYFLQIETQEGLQVSRRIQIVH